MTRLLSLRIPLAILVLALGSVAVVAQPAGAQDRPNVLIILADDLGWNDLGCYGNSYHSTPHIDSLSDTGLRFTDAYSGGPTCAPSRACLLSGQYCGRHGIFRVNQGDQNRKTNHQRLVAPENVTELPESIVTLADTMASSGYTTGCYGKWHLGETRPSLHPSQRGFHEAVQLRTPSGKKRYFYPKFSTRPDMPVKEGKYHPDLLTDLAVQFLEEHHTEPFFLYLPYFNVHSPLEAPQATIKKYNAKPKVDPSDHPVYAAMVEELDRCVGRLLGELKRLGVEDNTLVIFTSDNGAVASRNNAPLRAGKGFLYEGGIRVPLLASWPGEIPAGAVTREPVLQLDLYPTLAEIASAKLAEDHVLDGESLVAVLKEPRVENVSKRNLYWHYPTYQKWNSAEDCWYCEPHGAIRSGDYKLIDFMDSERVELYDLRNDIGEQHDLAASMPEKVEELRREMDGWRKGTKAPMPKRRL